MKDFISKTCKGLHLREESQEYIRRYDADAARSLIEVTYFNDKIREIPLNDKNLETLKSKQKAQFQRMKEAIQYGEEGEISARMDISLNTLSGLIAASTTLAINNYLINNPIVPLLGGAITLIYSSKAIEKLFNSMEPEIRLTSYLINHSDIATTVIREEVDKQRKPLNYQNLLLPYPDDSPYSEELYKRGLDLTTIDELSYQEQRELRKLVKTKIRENRRKKNG